MLNEFFALQSCHRSSAGGGVRCFPSRGEFNQEPSVETGYGGGQVSDARRAEKMGNIVWYLSLTRKTTRYYSCYVMLCWGPKAPLCR